MAKIITPNLFYVHGQCHRYTFDDKQVKEFVVRHCIGKTLNLFAGKNILDGVDEFRVDIDASMPNINFAGEAEDYIKIALAFDTIIWDPPWNERKSKEFYNGHYIGKFTKLKDDVACLASKRIISLGYEITNFGHKRGFELSQLMVVDPCGEIRPYFVAIEDKFTNGQ